MKESEKYANEKKGSRFFIIIDLIMSVAIIVSSIYLIANISCVVLCILGFFALLFLCPHMVDHIKKYRRAKKLEVPWRRLESEGVSYLVPADLKQKYLLYEAAIDVAEAYKKDVARMEARIRSIKAEIEAEMKK